MKKWICLLLAACMLSLTACGSSEDTVETTVPETQAIVEEAPLTAIEMPEATDPVLEGDVTEIVLGGETVTVNGEAASEEEGAVYISRDIVYYEDRDTYDSGNPYGEGEEADKHTAEEADAHVVVNITEPGNYRLSGTLTLGQIRIDLGVTAYDDPEAVVNLVLDNVNITCTVAPAILFKNVYECDGNWSVETARAEVDTTAAGANLILASGSENTVNGSYVARIYKDAEGEKKLCKQDGAIYSYMSMNVAGTGSLDLYAENEGLDSELHLTINGGNINIRSGNDGINTNEDGVSVTTVNNGNLHIIAGLGEEGDGIDSNGYLVINGGTVVASANPAADAGLDSDMGSYINGGYVIALGSTMDWAESDSDQVTMNLQFAGMQSSGSSIVVQRESGTVVFAYDPSADEVLGENVRQYMGAVISTPYFSVGESYEVYIGSTVSGTEVGGVYDVMTVTGASGGTQQAYSGTDVTMGFGGRGGMGQMGEMPQNAGKDFNGEIPAGTMPEGMDFSDFDPSSMEGEFTRPEGEMPEGGFGGGEMGEMPEGGFGGGEMGEMPQDGRGDMGERTDMPEGGTMPEGFDPESMGGQMPGGFGGMTTGGSNALFYMQDKVNFFSGLTAYTVN